MIDVFTDVFADVFTASVSSIDGLLPALKAAMAAHAMGRFSLVEFITPAFDVPEGAKHIVPSAYVD